MPRFGGVFYCLWGTSNDERLTMNDERQGKEGNNILYRI